MSLDSNLSSEVAAGGLRASIVIAFTPPPPSPSSGGGSGGGGGGGDRLNAADFLAELARGRGLRATVTIAKQKYLYNPGYAQPNVKRYNTSCNRHVCEGGGGEGVF